MALKKEWTEEPSSDIRTTFYWLSLIVISPESLMGISHIYR